MPMADSRDMWVFAYGSLMWDPGFPYLERHSARLYGYHRAFCIYSYIYRGTPERPGLVLGLDRGGSCKGVVFRIARSVAPAVADYLEEREMVTRVYRARRLPVHTGSGVVEALSYVADPAHPQYAGKLPLERAADLICQGHGRRGPALEYLRNTVAHLEELDIAEGPLHRLLDIVEARLTRR